MSEIQAILQTMDEGYIEGVHRQGNRSLTDKHFHNTFSMFIRGENDKIDVWSIDFWMDRIEKRKEEDPNSLDRKVDYTITKIDVQDSFATVLLDLYYDEKPYARDFFSLYKFDDGWKIMNKVYHWL